MGSAEKFCLRWNDFEANVSRSFAGIRESHHFFDVTLTTDDDDDRAEDLRAHKVILSACSEFFRNILVKESMSAHPNPLIYLRGISSQELRYVLDFMYHGEVNVAQDELDKFLEVAETLKIKGLTQNNESSSPPSSTSRPRPKIEPPSPSPAAMKRPSAPSPAGGEPKKRPKIHSSSASASPAVTPSTSKMQHHAEEVEVTPTTVKTEGGTVGAVDESAFEGGTGDGEGDEDYGDYEGADYDEGEYEGEDGAIAGPSGAGDGGGAGGAGGATKDFRSYLSDHVRKAPGGNLCTKCNTLIRQKGNLKRHFKDKHWSNAPIYHCPRCDTVYKSVNSFSNHLYKKHPGWKGNPLDTFIYEDKNVDKSFSLDMSV